MTNFTRRERRKQDDTRNLSIAAPLVSHHLFTPLCFHLFPLSQEMGEMMQNVRQPKTPTQLLILPFKIEAWSPAAFTDRGCRKNWEPKLCRSSMLNHRPSSRMEESGNLWSTKGAMLMQKHKSLLPFIFFFLTRVWGTMRAALSELNLEGACWILCMQI